jgi:hypothetical protein
MIRRLDKTIDRWRVVTTEIKRSAIRLILITPLALLAVVLFAGESSAEQSSPTCSYPSYLVDKYKCGVNRPGFDGDSDH